MPETNQLIFTFKELAALLVKASNVHEGIWAIFVNFGIQANNVGPNENELRPAAIIPILQLGLIKVDKETNLSVDAAKINPATPTNSKTKKATH
jgi:hypothetical protein